MGHKGPALRPRCTGSEGLEPIHALLFLQPRCQVGVVGQRHIPADLPPGKAHRSLGLDECAKSRPHRDSIPGPYNLQRVAIPITLSRPAFIVYIFRSYTCFSKRHRPLLDRRSFAILSSRTHPDFFHPNGSVSSILVHTL